MGMARPEFPVTVNRKEVVAAVLPLQIHWLPLSNLDLLLPPLDASVLFVYKKQTKPTDLTFSSMTTLLKKSLAQTLVSYYALAGEIVASTIGEPELLCNNRGVDFVEAYGDVEVNQLNFYNADATMEPLVPKKEAGVFAIQATELKCGGIVVACTFDHRVADAYSVDMFLVAWAESAQMKPISLIPSFRRSLLNSRRPGSYDASITNMYLPISSMPPPKSPQPGADHLISRIYYVKAEDIDKLQSNASSEEHQRTKLESFSAYLWRIVAKSSRDDTKRCTMGIVVDGRTRLGDVNGLKTSPMATYFGNVLSIPFGEMAAAELKKKTLSSVADFVHECLKDVVTKEHFLGLIDWVEARRPEPAVTKVYCKTGEDGAAFVVSSGQRFPVSKVDFGWGRPAFGSYHFPWGGEAGYVMPMPSISENGDWVVYMLLMIGQLDLLEEEAGDVFRPMTANYLI